jgi:hypothetical protein
MQNGKALAIHLADVGEVAALTCRRIEAMGRSVATATTPGLPILGWTGHLPNCSDQASYPVSCI